MAQLTVKVLRKKQEALDIASFELVKPDGSKGAAEIVDGKVGLL